MGSPAPPNRQPVPSGQNQAPWMQQPPNQAAGFPMRNGPQLPARGPSQPQTSPQMPQMGQTNPEQQRPGSTPHQLMPGQVPSQMSPALSNQFAGNRSNGQNMGQLTLPPPLEKGKFDESFAAFCSSRPTPRDERLRLIDNRPVDLHKLHFHVMREGGAPKVPFSFELSLFCADSWAGHAKRFVACYWRTPRLYSISKLWCRTCKIWLWCQSTASAPLCSVSRAVR